MIAFLLGVVVGLLLFIAYCYGVALWLTKDPE